MNQGGPVSINNGDEININKQHNVMQRKWKLLFFVTAFIIQAALLLKCPLYLLRQFLPRTLPHLCPENNVTRVNAEQKYIFTMIVYSILFIGRFVEALLVEICLYNFLFVQTVVNIREFKEHCIKGVTEKKWIWMILGFAVLIMYMFMHSLSVPALGISLEIRHGKMANCKGYAYGSYIIYWLLDIIRYMYDIGVRLFMLLATIAIGRIWAGTNGEDEWPLYTKEPETYSDYLQDRKVTNQDHKERTGDYTQRGREVEIISEIFQTWFILPWILFFVGSSLDTDHILRSWMAGSSSDGEYDFSEIAYLVYNFNQLFLLVFPYLCSKKMNTHHSKYFYRSREEQLAKHQTASRMALASMQKIEMDDHFDFTPRIWGTSIKIDVNDPLYIIFLLVSIFFTVCEALI